MQEQYQEEEPINFHYISEYFLNIKEQTKS